MFKVNDKDNRTTSFEVFYVSDILNCDLTCIIFSFKMLWHCNSSKQVVNAELRTKTIFSIFSCRLIFRISQLLFNNGFHLYIMTYKHTANGVFEFSPG